MNRFFPALGLIAVLISAAHGSAENRRSGNSGTADVVPTDGAIAQLRVDTLGAAARVRAERTRANAALGAIKSDSAQPLPQPYDVIDGKQNPELFLSYELFDELMLMGFADDAATREAYRNSKEYYRKAQGLPSDLWSRLDELSVLYRMDRARDKTPRPAMRAVVEAESTKASDLCRDRFEALSSAERAFGPAFRRFLYVAIAPDLFQVVLRQPDLARLLTVIGGCQ
jgi:hypothetical protein